MAMSSVEITSPSLPLGKSGKALITPTRSMSSGGIIKPPVSSTNVEASISYSVTGVRLNQGQQQATAVQIASQSLQVIGKELTSIKRNLTQAMQRGLANAHGIQEQLIRSKAVIERQVEKTRFDGQKVIDNGLRFNLDRADIRRFSIPGLNTNRLSDKAEQVRLDFPQGQSVMIHFDGHSEPSKMVKMLDRSLIPMGMRASLAGDGAILFEARDAAYQLMQQKVKITGEGHRFPAGQANLMTLKSEPDGVNEMTFDLGSREAIKQAISNVNRHLRQVRSSFDAAKAFHTDLQDQMQRIHRQDLLMSDEVNHKLEQWTSASSTFTTTFEALNAQANVRRHTVVALLK
ncbi:flagellin [Vibrio azureus]|uniref:Flagellin n=1 Tax=Vibrio azureus NBRC 104587 TaxID=1219077 RepID=U3A7S3_9VIBR|nr:hypothetical protein [Vibrio azureus]AUI88599.1 flagellin [Vibrio azureus]GAD76006.1 hypothetical protein VAZ01S_035_00130 [Vibrio azureus NBRC 104587]